ncbi:MAG TPA: DUF58 domain-containing protein [Lentisphaeria bacterium]|nr:DUF58 domain-containing protein [Lentisphaerota bacterium]HPY91004.1 DUF58 domain-containing protein [Lentisphaeria bacterium]
MIPKELSKKIRYIQIYTSKKVNDVLAGEYQSAFKGAGMEFDEVREYQPGDEVRSIDWNVTARQGHPFVKRFHEERELTVMFLVDLSASGQFGTAGQLKNDLAAELCALLSFSAVKSNDKVGLILFTDRIERFIPPAKSVSHALRIIREVLGFRPTGAQTDIAGALDFLGRVIRKRCVVFLVSDFQGEGFVKPMRVLSRKHDVIAVSVSDPRELHLPDVGLLELEDAETGEIVLVDTGSRAVRANYDRMGEQQRSHLANTFRTMDVDQIELLTGDDYAKKLVHFFRRREKRR